MENWNYGIYGILSKKLDFYFFKPTIPIFQHSSIPIKWCTLRVIKNLKINWQKNFRYRVTTYDPKTHHPTSHSGDSRK